MVDFSLQKTQKRHSTTGKLFTTLAFPRQRTLVSRLSFLQLPAINQPLGTSGIQIFNDDDDQQPSSTISNECLNIGDQLMVNSWLCKGNNNQQM